MEYTWLGLASVLATFALEAVLKTGLFRTKQYWLSMGIVAFFQALVDGWLTKLSATIVQYSDRHRSGLRFPFDIPVEDWLFGFSMVTATMLLWVHFGSRQTERDYEQSMQ